MSLKMLVIFQRFLSQTIFQYMVIMSKKIKDQILLTNVKTCFDNEQFQQSLPSTKNQSINNNQPSTTAENNQQQSQAEGSISEAGEEANIEYTVPPLSLLKQPTKQNYFKS